MSQMIRVLALTCLCLALAACAGDGGFEDVAFDSGPINPLYALTAMSAGPITPGTAYSAATLRRLFPGRRIQSRTIANEQRTFAALTVYEDGLQAVAVEGSGQVTAVHGLGPDVSGPNGERIGASFSSIGPSRSGCRLGRGLWGGLVMCPARGAPNVTLVFDRGGDTDDMTRMPARDALRRSRLERIVWTPAG